MANGNFTEKANFLWSVADLIRDDFKRGKYQDVILPLTVLRRIDCVLEPTKEAVLSDYAKYKGKLKDLDPVLRKTAGFAFYNTSKYNFARLLADPSNLAKNLNAYINGFSDNMREVIEKFDFRNTIAKLDEANLLYLTIQRFAEIDLHPDQVDNHEMGTIFEELIRRFNEALDENPGEHFTPREVVSLMVKLLLAVENEALSVPQKVVKVADPACGSGAYLLGMLHELLELRASLFAARKLDAQTVYQRKLEIIQNNLYGVDKDDFAVNIARLRLWLSLIVDYEGETPPPLPNLDFKIERGDSLTAPDPSGGLNLGFRGQLVDDFLLAKNQFTTAHHADKKSLKEQVKKLRDDIMAWSGRKAGFNGFDWTIEFAEIFIKPAPTATVTGAMAGVVNEISGQMELAVAPPASTGFDIILANPPYVRADAQFKHIEDEEDRQKEIAEWQAFRKRPKASKIYETLYEKWDLYIPFLERAYQLLRQNGQMVFIIPDAYNAAKYADKSHEFFLKNTSINRVDFCSEIDLFDAGVNNTILHYAKTEPTQAHQPVRVRRWGKRDDFETNQEYLSTNFQSELSEALFRPNHEITEPGGRKFPALGDICYVSVGMAIHADEKQAQGLFKAGDLISETKDKKHPKPYVEGKDIKRWAFQRVRYLEYGTNRAPAMFRRPTFIELHEPQEKLMAFRMCGENISVNYDDKKLMSNHTVILCVPWRYLKGVVNKSIKKAAEYKHQNPEGDREQREELSKKFNLKYVLAITNSSFAKTFLFKIRQSKLDIYPDEWKQLPIAPIPLEEQKAFVALVDKILGEYKKHGYPLPEMSAKKVREWEGQLDGMVGRLHEKREERDEREMRERKGCMEYDVG
ncbi:MAG: type I restriction-modification system subunit M N-terminal domain-containing protein [Anaerolineales bacterium]|nr:type I restriction-modification system subunit M N-terminal domain-containing protein [Anaerolineales bacterium]